MLRTAGWVNTEPSHLQLPASLLFLLGWVVKEFFLLRGNASHEAHHLEAVPIFVALTGDEFDNVVIEINATCSIKGETTGVTVKVAVENLITRMPLSVPFNAYFAPEALSMQHSSHGKYLGGRNRVGHVNELTVQLWSDLVWVSDGRVDTLTMFWEILCPSLLNLSEGAYTLFWVTAVAWVMTMSSFEMK